MGIWVITNGINVADMLHDFHKCCILLRRCCISVASVLQICYTVYMKKRIMVNFSEEEMGRYGLSGASGSDDVKRLMGGSERKEFREIRLRLDEVLGLLRGVAVELPREGSRSGDYSEVLGYLDKVMQEGYQMEADEKSKMNRLVKEAGLVWNGSSKKLWKQDGENWELIKEY